jgi:hypothetical protein
MAFCSIEKVPGVQHPERYREQGIRTSYGLYAKFLQLAPGLHGAYAGSDEHLRLFQAFLVTVEGVPIPAEHKEPDVYAAFNSVMVFVQCQCAGLVGATQDDLCTGAPEVMQQLIRRCGIQPKAAYRAVCQTQCRFEDPICRRAAVHYVTTRTSGDAAVEEDSSLMRSLSERLLLMFAIAGASGQSQWRQLSAKATDAEQDSKTAPPPT